MDLSAFYLQAFISGTFPFLFRGWQSSAMVDGTGFGVGPGLAPILGLCFLISLGEYTQLFQALFLLSG